MSAQTIEKTWVECGQCEDGYSYHDCGEDSCCCLNPEPNVVCDTCNGEGGWYIDEYFGDTIRQDELSEIIMWRQNKQREDFRAAMTNWPPIMVEPKAPEAPASTPERTKT